MSKHFFSNHNIFKKTITDSQVFSNHQPVKKQDRVFAYFICILSTLVLVVMGSVKKETVLAWVSQPFKKWSFVVNKERKLSSIQKNITKSSLYKFRMKPLLVKFKRKSKVKIAKIDIFLDMSDFHPKDSEKIDGMKDQVLVLLSEYTDHDLSNWKVGKIEKSIQEQLNMFLSKGKIENVYFKASVVN